MFNTPARFLDALRDDSTVLVSGNGYVCATRSQLPHAPYPDLIIAFGVDHAALVNNNGFEIGVVGKPPDLVPEVASEHTGHRDYNANATNTPGRASSSTGVSITPAGSSRTCRWPASAWSTARISGLR